MNPTHTLSVIGTVMTASAVAAITGTASPSAASAQDVQTYTGQATDNLNIRSAPGTDQPRIGMFRKGQTFEVIGISKKSKKANWLKINYHHRTAYVDGYYVTHAQAPSQRKPSQDVETISDYQGIATENLHVRFLPSTNGTILTTLGKGTEVTVIGKTTDGWLQIKYRNGSAYVSSKYIKKTGGAPASANHQESSVKTLYTGVTTDNLNVRNQASVNGKRLTTLKKGTKVEVVGASGRWLKIKYNGGTAYVSGQYVQKPGSGHISSGSAGSGTTLKTLYTGVTTDNLNVRNQASVNGKRLTTLKKGTKVEVVGASDSWLKIKYNGGTAYVSGQYVQKPGPGHISSGSAGSGTTLKTLYTGVTTDNLNVRNQASVNGKRLTTLKKGTKVEVVGASGSWLKIKYNGGTAYVSGDYVRKAGTGSPGGSSTPSQPSSSKTFGVITTGVHFRVGPDTHYDSLAILKAGTIVEWLADTGNGWVKVSSGGKDGYVYSDYVKKETVTNVQDGNTAYLTTKYPISYSRALAMERKVNSSSDLSYYLNPKNFEKGTTSYFQFLQLSSLANISQSDMDGILKGAGILSGYGSTFIDAAKRNGVNEVYLAAHALHETGYGSSRLANGVEYKGVKVYNMFGIGAFDVDPRNGGAALAYMNGWTTPHKAIEGGAVWIAQHYIYNSIYRQDTLYKMRWNPEALVMGSATHQYATDVGWAVNQTPNIAKMYKMIKTYNIIYDVPQFY
ncbi:hypothetical protein EWI07_05950 [Sporolactobacillus sp. THM7-4]|nr:hypothetical protein EWI07_05950 [Sporolactobacillus sp. THM7-4]